MILPPFSDAREFLLPTAMSFSEMATLSHCEKKWKLIYDAKDRPDNDPTDAMELGSEMHRLLGNWWMKQDASYLDTLYDDARWLMERYHEHYMGSGMLQMEALEVPFAVKAFGTWLFGWMDGLVRDFSTGDLWIAEFKTMGNWTKLHQLPKDKQVTLYIYAARRMGLPVKGVMYDAIRTYRWTGKNADQHAPAESFQRIWVERTDEEIAEFIEEVQSTLARKSDLFMNLYSPIRNVGQGCSWCPCMPECFDIDLTLLPDDGTLAL